MSDVGKKEVPTHVEPKAPTGIFPTPWQYPVPPKRRTAACDKCVDVDTFSHRLGPHKGEPSLRPMYAKETKGTPNAINANAGSLTRSSYIELIKVVYTSHEYAW